MIKKINNNLAHRAAVIIIIFFLIPTLIGNSLTFPFEHEYHHHEDHHYTHKIGRLRKEEAHIEPIK